MVMKKIFLILFLFLSVNSYSQQKKDSTNLWWFRGKYVSEKEWEDSLHSFNIKYFNVTKPQPPVKRKNKILRLFSTRFNTFY